MDAGKVYQIFINLIQNSLDATGNPGKITIRGILEDNDLVITLQDDGEGIRKDALPNIFDPFFTTKGAHGTGLGLAIVKTIMETHRGSIHCESSFGQGTRFILRFPGDGL